ncbi:DUF2461 domain-containing protein [Umezawaea tangerina]|uniref:Uncharacterized protein (TIGR02453 family) n=1 Tax=Umezawaea tangerina TaxID=84725 RepID=A0A2T0T9R0_9PSEU|nr:DUF2461 domain-containing protein [Umezawaea tangerina]PRY42403.1 uncharacterized protein (TIGR02453 family) [Umezawaea tangerina]
MEFSGFGEHAIDFFDGLEADNSKVYWDANKSTYQEDVRAPMLVLLNDLEPEFGPGKVFRPFRDVRFSKDKTPYKTHCGGVVEQGRGGGAFYVQIGVEGVMVGGGSFAMASDQLARFRTAVDEDRRGGQLEKIVAKLEKSGWDIRGDRLKSKPRGVAPEHPRIELLRHRTLYAAKVWPPDDTLHEPGCGTRVVKAWRELKAFNEWCVDHVGVSEKPWR